MLRRPRIASLVAVALVGVLASGSVAAPQLAASGPGTYPGIQPQVPDPYFPLDGNPGFAAGSYDIRLRYRFSDGYLSGRAEFIAFSSRDLSQFRLDLLLEVDSVTVFDNVDDEGLEAEFRKVNRHEVVVTPARRLRNGDPDIVVVKYHGYPSRIGWNGEPNWLADRHEVVTMNDTHMAPWWFPANEHPSDPMSFDLRLTTAKTKDVISNGELVSRTVNGRTATTHWRVGPYMAPHLAFFAAGDFDIETGSRRGLTYYNAVSQRLGDRVRKASMATLRKSAGIVAWMESEVGEYWFGSTGGLVTSLRPGFSVANLTRPTYPANPTKQMLVDELARQWFGGGVRISQWADVWLNEGFATYLGWRYDAAHGGPSTARVLDRLYRQYRDRPGFWNLSITDPGPHRIFDRRVALRGAMLLSALRNVVGPDRFREVLAYWVQLRGGRHSSTEVFEAYLPKAFYRFGIPMTERHLTAFLDAWLRGNRPPPNRPRYGL